LPEAEAADATKQMLLAVTYVHCHGIVHRDLKLENFLYASQGSTHLKLIDFGFSKFHDTKHRMHTSCGTLAYVAPEVLNRSYTSQCDLWSMGVIVFILLSGHMPFYGKEDAQIRDITKGQFVMKAEHWSGVSSHAKAFVKGLLEVNPDKRLTAKAALQQPWIVTNCQELELDFQPMVSALRSWLVAPPLLRACMCMMAWTLTNEQQAMVRDHFIAIDSNHDGAISFLELRSIMVDKHGVPEEEVRAIFSVFTAAHDREIHYSDILAAMTCENIEPDDDLLHAAFSRFDTKGVGHIVAEDFHDLLGVSLEDGHADAFVQEADVKGCGSIDYTEFADYVHDARLRTKSQDAKAWASFALSITLPPPDGSTCANPTLLGSQRRAGSDKKVMQEHPKEMLHGNLEMKDACCVLM
jgi:calcium-dependent protein kinase